jgi:hypothetical protein
MAPSASRGSSHECSKRTADPRLETRQPGLVQLIDPVESEPSDLLDSEGQAHDPLPEEARYTEEADPIDGSPRQEGLDDKHLLATKEPDGRAVGLLLQGHLMDQDPINPPLENRWGCKPPDWMDKDQALGPDRVLLVTSRERITCWIAGQGVGLSILQTQDGVKPIGKQVMNPHLAVEARELVSRKVKEALTEPAPAGPA